MSTTTPPTTPRSEQSRLWQHWPRGSMRVLQMTECTGCATLGCLMDPLYVNHDPAHDTALRTVQVVAALAARVHARPPDDGMYWLRHLGMPDGPALCQPRPRPRHRAPNSPGCGSIGRAGPCASSR